MMSFVLLIVIAVIWPAAAVRVKGDKAQINSLKEQLENAQELLHNLTIKLSDREEQLENAHQLVSNLTITLSDKQQLLMTTLGEWERFNGTITGRNEADLRLNDTLSQRDQLLVDWQLYNGTVQKREALLNETLSREKAMALLNATRWRSRAERDIRRLRSDLNITRIKLNDCRTQHDNCEMQHIKRIDNFTEGIKNLTFEVNSLKLCEETTDKMEEEMATLTSKINELSLSVAATSNASSSDVCEQDLANLNNLFLTETNKLKNQVESLQSQNAAFRCEEDLAAQNATFRCEQDLADLNDLFKSETNRLKDELQVMQNQLEQKRNSQKSTPSPATALATIAPATSAPFNCEDDLENLNALFIYETNMLKDEMEALRNHFKKCKCT